MPVINTADDLLALLRENQEFREAVRQVILTEELLALPVMFQELRAEVREYAETTNKRLDSLEQSYQRLEQSYQRLEQGQQRHTNDIGELKGVGLETKLYNRGVSLVATLLRVHNGQRIRVAEKDHNSDRFNRTVLHALENGVLSEEEYDRILDTDMIVSGNRAGSSQTVYTAIEASYSISRVDIAKVKQTADILSGLFADAEIHAAIYCMNVASLIEEEADQQGVHLIRARNLLG
jgi:hypothetical protein